MLNPAQKIALAGLFPPGRVFSDPASLLTYEIDAGTLSGSPQAIVIVTSAEEAQRLVGWAKAQGMNLVARGAGTGLTGGAVATEGGILANFSRMNGLIDVDEDSRQAVVQPGLVNQTFQRRLAPYGLIYPPDPASYAVSTLGGNIAENAGGPHCLKYGVTNNYVQALEVVLADGQRLWLGSRSVDPPEYDYPSLVTGSEGTLALITLAVLRLSRPAIGVKTLTASFADVAVAGEAVSAVITSGMTPATIELMDHNMINIVEDYLSLGLLRQAAALLIFDIEGYPESLDVQLDGVAEILGRFSPLEVKLARTVEERERLWLGRRNASGAVARISPSEYVLDVCVPRSRLAEALRAFNAIAERYGLPIAYLAHAGDGNLHPGLLCNLKLEEDRRRVEQAGDEILQYCAQIGGSIGGEHGIGIEKRASMPAMYGADELAVMLEVKHVFDPGGLFNPGKIFPVELARAEPRSQPPTDLPGEIFIPASPEETADGLRALQTARQVTRVIGAGQQWQGEADGGVRLVTAQMDGIVKLSATDFYVTALAGTTFQELQVALAERGLHLAAGSPWSEVTLGGMVAANLNGPRRTRYGSLRDQVLAVQTALGDGRLVRFGRPLVKDVAGYQMNKLFCGSYGTLGVLTELTLKVSPLPSVSRTLVISAANTAQALRLAFVILRKATLCAGLVITPGGLEIPATGCSLWLTLEGHAADVAAELGVLRKEASRLDGLMIKEVEHTSAAQTWDKRLAAAKIHLRVAVPPSALPALVDRLGADQLGRDWIIDAANGILMVVEDLADAGQMEMRLEWLHQAAESYQGYALMAAGPRRWLTSTGAWGKPRPAQALMQSLKLKWDPADILNRAEFIRRAI